MTAPPLEPGDVLLYRGDGVFSRLIQMKTWSRVSHCEAYVGEGASVASRDGIGVGCYPLRTAGLAAVLRPIAPFDRAAALAWFHTVDGQGYDWVGLLAFFAARWQGRENRRMFCSEFLTRFQRAGGIEPFTPDTDADAIAPGEFLKSGAYRRVALNGHVG